MLRVPNRGCAPPSRKFAPSALPKSSVVAARPEGPAANETWSRCMRPILYRPVSGAVRRGRQSVRSVRCRHAGVLERLAVTRQLGVAVRSHERLELGAVGDVDRLHAHVRLGVRRAVPVEVGAARAPAGPGVLADLHLGVRAAVARVDLAELPTDRQLPADVGLGGQRLDALGEGESVQRAPVATGEVARVVEDAGAVDSTGLELALVVLLGPVVTALGVTLPALGREPLDRVGHSLVVRLVGEVRAERAAAGLGAAGEDARTAG